MLTDNVLETFEVGKDLVRKVWPGWASENITDAKVSLLGKMLLYVLPFSSTKSKSKYTFSPLRILWLVSVFHSACGQRTSPFPEEFDLSSLDGGNGFVIHGARPGDQSGFAISNAGDVNGDGTSDLIIGAYSANGLNNKNDIGKSYVVFGGRNVGSGGTLALSSLMGQTGFVINGNQTGDHSGFSVSSAGDINGDGVSDLLLGAPETSPIDMDRKGKAYIIFGGVGNDIGLGNGGIIELSTINSTNGCVLEGVKDHDSTGSVVANVGDINGDGVDDILIGAPLASASGMMQAGKTYVIFGRKMNQPLHFTSSNAYIPLPIPSGFTTISTQNNTEFVPTGSSFADSNETQSYLTALLIISGSVVCLSGVLVTLIALQKCKKKSNQIQEMDFDHQELNPQLIGLSNFYQQVPVDPVYNVCDLNSLGKDHYVSMPQKLNLAK